MKHILTLLFLAITALVSAEELRGIVISVHDGDTYTLQDSTGNKIKIRQLGIDAPELKQPYGIESRDFSKSIILNKEVIVHTTKKDMYGRTIGSTKVVIGEKNYDVEATMLHYGYAWHYSQYYKSDRFHQEEESARKNRIGLWKDESPTPPWIFRKARRVP